MGFTILIAGFFAVTLPPLIALTINGKTRCHEEGGDKSGTGEGTEDLPRGALISVRQQVARTSAGIKTTVLAPALPYVTEGAIQPYVFKFRSEKTLRRNVQATVGLVLLALLLLVLALKSERVGGAENLFDAVGRLIGI